MWIITILTYFITFLVIIFSFIYVYIKLKYTTWKRKNIPYLEPNFPFGNIKSFALQTDCIGDSIWRCYKDLQKKTSLFGGFYAILKPVIIVLDPDLIKSILVKDFAHFVNRSDILDDYADPITRNLIFLKGEKWRKARSILTPTFSPGKLKNMFHTILETGNELGNVIDQYKNKPIDTKDIFARQAIDTIGSCVFGLECNSLKYPNTEFRKYGKKIFEMGNSIIDKISNVLFLSYPVLPNRLKIPILHPGIANFFSNILKQTVEYREKHNVQRNDFLNLMIQLKNNHKQSGESIDSTSDEDFTFKDIVAHSFSFFSAGFETSSSALNFCFFEISNNLDIQEKVRNEVLGVTSDYNGAITYDGIKKMKYMDKVIQEVLRKYPSVPVLERGCTKDYKMPNSDFIVKKGTVIYICPLGLHRDPAYYPEPNKFDPERFSEEQKSKRHPFTYVPFGEGPRNCIGMRFAWLHMKIVLSTLLLEFKFTLDPKTVLPIEFDPIGRFLTPKHTIWLRAERI